MAEFTLVFDEIMLTQLKKLGEDTHTRKRLTKFLDKLEQIGPRAGKLLDSKLFIYEIKAKSPPLRLYFQHIKNTDELYVFEYELKTNSKKQNQTINKLRKKGSEQFRNQDHDD